MVIIRYLVLIFCVMTAMLMQTKQKIKQNKVLMTICLDEELLKQFKKVAQKDLRKYSNIVEGSIRRYVQSKI